MASTPTWGRALCVGIACAMWLTACATSQPTSPGRQSPGVQVLNVTVEPALFRVSVRWQGTAPADREQLLLERCAQLTQALGSRYFYIVNASEPVAHMEWLKAGGIDTPIMVIPDSEIPGGGSLTALVRAFPRTREPTGYRLYDAERILRDRKAGTAARMRSEKAKT